MVTEIEKSCMSKVAWRLIPLLIAGYFFAFVDKVNVGFAALTMNKDLGLSSSAFGFGAGIFFIAYFLFGVPSNLVLVRVGARRWIACILCSFALAAGAMAFIEGPRSFFFVRFIVGAAEAGFFPGIIFYMTQWFPALHRARMMGYFIVAIPLSFVVGAPLSALFLHLNGVFGLAGWKWLYLCEAVPAILISFTMLKVLSDRPQDAKWLSASEKSWLADTLASERAEQAGQTQSGTLSVLVDPNMLALALIYSGAVATTFGVVFFLPTIVHGFGLSITQTSLVTIIPYGIGAVGMVLWGWDSDRRQERKFHAAISLFLAGAGVAGAAVLPSLAFKIAAFSLGAFGTFSLLPVFWTMPPRFLAGATVAAGIAAINSLGNLTGFAAPFAVGFIKDRTGQFFGGLLLIAGLAIVSSVTVLLLHRQRPSLPRA